MKVRELIALLQAEDPEIDVLVDGYEGGVSDVTGISPIEVMVDYNKNTCYYGEHEEVADYHEWAGPTKKGILIPR